MVPDGVEEVELERVNLEQKERALNLIFDDIRKLSMCTDTSGDAHSEKERNLWLISGGRSILVRCKTVQLNVIYKCQDYHIVVLF